MMSPHGVYPCRPDDRGDPAWVAIAARNDAERQRLETAIGRPADELAEWTAGRDATAVEVELQALGIPAHRALSPHDAIVDPQLRHQGHFVELDHPVHGTTVVEASRYRLSRTHAQTVRSAPTIGADTDHVLRDLLGYDDTRMAALTQREVLR